MHSGFVFLYSLMKFYVSKYYNFTDDFYFIYHINKHSIS